MSLNAPWTDDQVRSLNGFQSCGFLHPFTCGKGSHVLLACADGWKCPECNPQQNGPVVQAWCHGFMADWSWEKMNLFAGEGD